MKLNKNTVICYTYAHVFRAIQLLEFDSISPSSNTTILLTRTDSSHICQEVYKRLNEVFHDISFSYVDISDCSLWNSRKAFLLYKFLPALRKHLADRKLNSIVDSILHCETVYLFHDSPIISRLILTRRKATLIEEGASNSREFTKRELLKKRMLHFLFGYSLPIGRNCNIQRIITINYDLPQDIKHKEVRYALKISPGINKKFLNVFRVDVSRQLKGSPFTLLVMQNFSKSEIPVKQIDKLIGRTLEKLQNTSEYILVKMHPGDTNTYMSLAERDCVLLNAYLPIEALESEIKDCGKVYSFLHSSVAFLTNRGIPCCILFPDVLLIEELSLFDIQSLHQKIDDCLT